MREITTPLRSPLDGYRKPRKPVEKKTFEPDERACRLIEYLKEAIGMSSLGGHWKANHNACLVLLERAERDFPNHDPEVVVKTLIAAALQDNFHAKNTTTFRYLVDHGQSIIRARQLARRKPVKELADGDYSAAVNEEIASRFGGDGNAGSARREGASSEGDGGGN